MTVPEYETPPAPAVVVDPRTQAAIWAAVNVAFDDTTILNLVSPRGIIALKSGRSAAGTSTPAKYIVDVSVTVNHQNQIQLQPL